MITTTGTRIEHVLAKSPVQSHFLKQAQHQLTVLAYHNVNDAERFEQQIAFLTSRFEPLAIEDVRAAIHEGQPLPQRGFLITFDDGYRSVLETALPIMSRYKVPGIVYVIASLLDTKVPFWWSEVETLVQNGGETMFVRPGVSPDQTVRILKLLPNSKRLAALDQLRDTSRVSTPAMPQLSRPELHELQAGGIEIGNHTLTHPCLHQCDGATILHELSAAQEILSDVLGAPPRSFAYPNGDHDPRVVRAVERIGFDTAFLFDHRKSPNPPPQSLRISRLRVSADQPMDRFQTIVSGLHPFLHRMRGGA